MASDPTPAAMPSAPASTPPEMGATYPYPYPYEYSYAYPYAAPGYYPWMFASPAPRLSTWALVSMICGAVSVVSFQPIVAVLAIVFGFLGLNEVKKSPAQVEGRGFGIAGIVTGFISLGITLLFIALYIVYIIVLFSALSTLPK